jgi:hypothetical protein
MLLFMLCYPHKLSQLLPEPGQASAAAAELHMPLTRQT